MKKLISCLMAGIILLCAIGAVFASSAEEKVVFTLSGLGIIDAETPTDEQVSRGEFAHIAIRLLNLAEAANATDAQTAYLDVPADYEYARDISLLTQMGILNGVSENMFSPLAPVSYEQAIKVLIIITGYDDIAKNNGGWPGGYIAVAGRCGMLDNVSLTNPFPRKELYRLVYNALEVKLVDEIISDAPDKELVVTGDTLGKKLADGEDKLYKHKGVITANSYTYTTSPYSDLADNEVVIENTSVGGTYIYKIGKTNAFDLVGCEVDFYAKDVSGVYELLAVKPTDNNEIIEVSAENIGTKNDDSLSYIDENDNAEKLTLDSNIKITYNGTRVLSPGSNVFEIDEGYVRFISNDADGDFEIAMVWEYENAVATAFDGQRFSFLNDASYDNLNSLFVDTDDRGVKMLVSDRNGNAVESFDAERTVSIFKDRDAKRYRVVVSDETIEGKLESISDDSAVVEGEEYETSASLKNDMKIGQNYVFYVSFDGKLAFSKSKDVVNYGYLLSYNRKNAFSGISARVILPKTVDDGVETNEEDVTDTSSVPYLILQNSGVQIFDFAESVRCDGKSYSGDSLAALLENGTRVISYKLNDDGEIKEIIPLEKYGGDAAARYQYNVYDRVFGGASVDQTSGFALNSATQVVCVPTDDRNNIRQEASDEDLDVKVNITVANNDVGYRVEGYDFDEGTKKVRLLVAFATMDSALTSNIDVFTTRASMVTSVRHVYNSETGEEEQIIDVLRGSEEVTLKPIEITSANSTISKLKAGDLICYNTNNNDLMDNVEIIQSISQLKDDFEYISGSRKKTLGVAGRIEYDEVDTYNRNLVTKLEVYVSGSEYPREFTVPQTNVPPVYVYNKGNETVQYATLKDIRPNNEKIFVFERDGDSLVRAIVLIRD